MSLGLIHLHEHKFRHCFQDTLNLLCEGGEDIESTMHFLLHCTNFLITRQTLFEKIRDIDDSILSQSETQLTQTLLYGNQHYHASITRLIIISTIEYYFNYRLKDSNACFLIKVSFFFSVKRAGYKTGFNWWLLYLCYFISSFAKVC